jgi:serine/threonine-protein kinase
MSFTSEEIREAIATLEVEMRQPGGVLFSQARYEIERVLGEGGMGITCLAQEYSSSNLKRPIVLKFVKDSLDPVRMQRFLNEVQLSILFNHPNLVPVYRLEAETLSVAPAKGKSTWRRPHSHTIYYAVMQYIDGWNLRQLVERLRSLEIALNHDLAMFVIGRVARGLHYVHQYRDDTGEHLGLVHRDVSPENILIDRFGRVKVADFGIAKSEKQTQGDDAWLMAGKLMYCAPEQLDGAPIDARADIYNIGLLIYFLFTNNDRFAPEVRLPKSRSRIRRKMTRSPLADMPNVSPALAHICETCLQEDPNARYQSCEDLATDIDIYFQASQKVLTNEQLEEVLLDLFSKNPTFVSRRFIPLTGSSRLEQPGYDSSMDPKAEEDSAPLPTVRLDEAE